jgi:hypothetical protein
MCVRASCALERHCFFLLSRSFAFFYTLLIIIIIIISLSLSPVAVGHNSGLSEEIRCRVVERVTSEMATEGKKLYTLSDVAVHNISNDCWLIIGGKVKDPCPLWSSVFSASFSSVVIIVYAFASSAILFSNLGISSTKDVRVFFFFFAWGRWRSSVCVSDTF